MLPLPLRCPAEFIFIYRELGGNVWIRDGRGQTALELADNSSAPALEYLKQFQGEFSDWISYLSSLSTLFCQHPLLKCQL